MIKLTLEFIPQRRRPWPLYLMLLVAAACAAAMLAQWLQLQGEQARLRAALSRQELQLKVLQREQQLRSAAAPALVARQKEQAKVAAALRYPWNNVLSTLELADMSGIAMLSFSHEQAGGRTQLTLEAIDIDALARFTDSLNEGGDGGEGWYVSSYQVQQQANPVVIRAVVFSK
ncbi:hypothetical protein LPN04_10760 [Rugamonas sp. A1-17]|nr:hypothetical protein [Rugamonas sp. A1-17]